MPKPLPGYQSTELSPKDLANLVLVSLDAFTDSQCKILSKEICEKMDQLVDQLTNLEEYPVCRQDWIDILLIRDPKKLIRLCKTELQYCLKDKLFPQCPVIRILVNEELVNLLKKEGC